MGDKKGMGKDQDEEEGVAKCICLGGCILVSCLYARL